MNYFLILLVVVGILGGGYYEYTSLQDESIDYQRKIAEQRDKLDYLEAKNKQYEDDKTLLTRAKWDEAQAKIADLTKQVQTVQAALDQEKKNEADAAAAAAAASAANSTNQAPVAPPPPPPPSNKLGTIVTTDGKTYTNCVLMKVDPDGIVINDSDGITKVLYALMSPELQKRFDFDPKQGPLTQEQVDILEIKRKASAQLGN
jgi:hypothetical protein